MGNHETVMTICGALGLVGLFGVASRWEGHREKGVLGAIGVVCGGIELLIRFLVGVGVFLFSWFWAISNWGWLLGIAFGWIPAGIVALMAAYLWWVACYALFFLLFFTR